MTGEGTRIDRDADNRAQIRQCETLMKWLRSNTVNAPKRPPTPQNEDKKTHQLLPADEVKSRLTPPPSMPMSKDTA